MEIKEVINWVKDARISLKAAYAETYTVLEEVLKENSNYISFGESGVGFDVDSDETMYVKSITLGEDGDIYLSGTSICLYHRNSEETLDIKNFPHDIAYDLLVEINKMKENGAVSES